METRDQAYARVCEELTLQAERLRANGWHKLADKTSRKLTRIIRRYQPD
jgi:hypothetical protein